MSGRALGSQTEGPRVYPQKECINIECVSLLCWNWRQTKNPRLLPNIKHTYKCMYMSTHKQIQSSLPALSGNRGTGSSQPLTEHPNIILLFKEPGSPEKQLIPGKEQDRFETFFYIRGNEEIIEGRECLWTQKSSLKSFFYLTSISEHWNKQGWTIACWKSEEGAGEHLLLWQRTWF